MNEESKRLESFNKFIHAEQIRIDEAKWYEGEKIYSDPGASYIFNWIQQNAVWFREQWDKSICKNCKKWKQCAHKVKIECDKFEKEEDL